MSAHSTSLTFPVAAEQLHSLRAALEDQDEFFKVAVNLLDESCLLFSSSRKNWMEFQLEELSRKFLPGSIPHLNPCFLEGRVIQGFKATLLEGAGLDASHQDLVRFLQALGVNVAAATAAFNGDHYQLTVDEFQACLGTRPDSLDQALARYSQERDLDEGLGLNALLAFLWAQEAMLAHCRQQGLCACYAVLLY